MDDQAIAFKKMAGEQQDKPPYKTYLYSIINEGGRKSGNAGYFIVINPGECYVGAGVFQKVPKDFDSDSPAGDFLKMKGYFVRNYYRDTFFRGKDNFETIVECFKACQNLNIFVNSI